jgi:hypothetical protein
VAWKAIEGVSALITSLTTITNLLKGIPDFAKTAGEKIGTAVAPTTAAERALTPPVLPPVSVPFIGAPFVVGEAIDAHDAELLKQAPQSVRDALQGKDPFLHDEATDKLLHGYLDQHPDDKAA